MMHLNLKSIKIDHISCTIFDMDNTLFDFVEAKITACQEIVNYLGKGNAQELLQYFIRSNYGFEDWNNIRDYIIDNGVYSHQVFEECCKIYETEKIKAVRPYKNSFKTLKKLKHMGLKTAILTDAHSANARRRINKIGFSKLLDEIFCSDITGYSKPAPETFLYVLDALNINSSQILYVGDSLYRDILPAKKLGMITAYAAYGDRNDHSVKDTSCADIILCDIYDIVKLFEIQGK